MKSVNTGCPGFCNPRSGSGAQRLQSVLDGTDRCVEIGVCLFVEISVCSSQERLSTWNTELHIREIP